MKRVCETEDVAVMKRAKSQCNLIEKLISGGQCGADRAALEAAYALGIETGGWAPEGFITTAGKDPVLGTKFKLQELRCKTKSIADLYRQRTMKNVDEADATIAFRLEASVGTDNTIGYCINGKWQRYNEKAMRGITFRHRPCLVIRSLAEEDFTENKDAIQHFIKINRVETLNVAGHRNQVIDGYSTRIESLLKEALVTSADK